MSKNKNEKPGWKIWRFDQMATNVNVRIDNPSESGMEHYVGLEHLDTNSLKIRRWGKPSDVEAGKLCFKKGDIIFAKRRAYQRKLGVAEFDGICSAHAMVLRAKPDVMLPGFLPFFMQSDLFMNRAIEISVGSLSPTINWKTMAAQEFEVPPLAKQRNLSELLISIETSCNELTNLVNEGSNMVNTIFANKAWGEGSELLKPIGDIADINPRVAVVTEDDPFITMDAVDAWTQHIDLARIEKKGSRSGIRAIGGDILMARITPCLENGKIAQVPFSIDKCGGSTEFIVFRAKEQVNQQYVYHLITSPKFHSQAKGTMSGSTGRQRASAGDIERIPIPALRLEKQAEVCQMMAQILRCNDETKLRFDRLLALKRTVLTEMRGD